MSPSPEHNRVDFGAQGRTTPPRLPAAYLPRERLDALRQTWESCRVVLVQAGAGYGKTTLVAANAGQSPRRLFWYTLDFRDVDFNGFAAGLAPLVGLEAHDPGAGTPADTHRLTTNLVTGLLRQIGGATEGWNIVFDDCQAASGAPEVTAFLGHLARLLPEGCTLFLLSREPIRLRAGSLRAAGLVATVGVRDLQFTREEAVALCRARLPRLAAEAGELDRVAARTEGWAAGLSICLQYLERTPGQSLKEALRGFDRAGPEWFDYFAEEVLATLDDETQDFLLRASVLPRLTPALCDHVLGIRSSRRILETLRDRNLFTFEMTGGDSGFRFHQLFQEFLQLRLPARVDERDRQRLQARAARRLEAEGAWLDALEARLSAGEVTPALRLVERRGEAMLDAGRPARFRRALERIDPAERERHPWTLFRLGCCLDAEGRWEEAEKIYRRTLRRRPSTPLRVEVTAMLAQMLNRRGRHAECVRLCRRALATPGWRNPRTWGWLLWLLGTSAAELGQFEEADRQLRQAVRFFARTGNTYGEARTQYLIAINVCYPRGEFRAARDAGRRAIVLFQQRNDVWQICHSLGVLGFIAAAAGQEAEAREISEEALHRAENLGHRAMEALCLFSLGRCAQLRGDLATAQKLLGASRRAGQILGETDLMTYPRLALAEVALARGNRHAARAEALEVLRFARSNRDLFQEAQAATLLGVGAGAGTAAARTWWRKSERILRAIGARYELHRLLLIRIDAGDVRERDVAARLRELLAGVAELGHEALMLTVEPRRGAAVLTTAFQRNIEQDLAAGLLEQLGDAAVPGLEPLISDPAVADAAIRLLGRIGGDRARQALARVKDPTTRSGRLALRAWDDLSRRPEAPLRIETLGPFRLAVGDRHLPRDTWRSMRSLRLFLFLLMRRFRWVSRDEICDAFWPDADPSRAANNLTQTVFLLRQCLEPELAQARLSRHVLVREDACRLEPGDGAFWDAARFEEEIIAAEAADRVGRRADAEAGLRRALGLYRGDFMEEIPHEELVAAERERLRDRLLHGLSRLLDLLATDRRWPEILPLAATGESRDPYHEPFHRHHIAALIETGRFADALAAYSRYEELLRRELGLSPSPALRALGARITAGR